MEAAWGLRLRGESPEAAARYLHEHLTRPPSPASEVEQAVEKVYGVPLKSNGTAPPRVYQKKTRVAYLEGKLRAVAAKMDGFGRSQLALSSPIPPSRCTAGDFIDLAFEPGEHILLFDRFRSQGCGIATATPPPGKDALGNDALDCLRLPKPGQGIWFLANPVDAQWREIERLKRPENPKGRTRRAEENVVAFRYLVLESDTAPPDLWLQALVQLPLPVTSIVTSGGKSLHALIRLDAENGAHWRELRDKLARPLILLGCDPATMTPVRLTRLPGCYRAEKGRWQELLYLNPSPTPTPICELPTL